ncbi:hypothetical protein NDU88_000798 [Pleurodeles waltl]|uniref:Uncharacterized protein n=1 Tax=Pleurodeles waltl TaxID=8319 RepID=A0AAV7TFU0_PLEWA|nr:hypothetical protein NDU88_000798 [Pleurodeles waltl]
MPGTPRVLTEDQGGTETDEVWYNGGALDNNVARSNHEASWDTRGQCIQRYQAHHMPLNTGAVCHQERNDRETVNSNRFCYNYTAP